MNGYVGDNIVVFLRQMRSLGFIFEVVRSYGRMLNKNGVCDQIFILKKLLWLIYKIQMEVGGIGRYLSNQRERE